MACACLPVYQNERSISLILGKSVSTIKHQLDWAILKLNCTGRIGLAVLVTAIAWSKAMQAVVEGDVPRLDGQERDDLGVTFRSHARSFGLGTTD